MNETHELQVASNSKDSIESVDPKFLIGGLLRAREKTAEVLGEIKSGLKEGSTEDEARKLAMEIFADHGVKKHWHKPFIRFGPGTALTYDDPLQPEYHLQSGDPFYIDIGPAWQDSESQLIYEGDLGDTFVLGANAEAEKCAATARKLFTEAREQWRHNNLTGREIYAFLNGRASQLGYKLVEQVAGHRLSELPHHKYSREGLGNMTFHPSASLWILEVQIRHPVLKLGAFFEDLL